MNTCESIIKQQVETMLKNEILPFWLKLIDHEHGGFFGCVDNNGELDRSADKGGVLHTRILWAFSEAYRRYDDVAYLEAAGHAYRFLVDKMSDATHGGLFWMLDYAGRPIQQFKHAYHQAFGIYACSAYALATKSDEAKNKAKDLFLLLEDKWHDGFGYREQLSRDFLPMENVELAENNVMPARTMNTLLHIMEAYTTLYQAWPDERVKDALTSSVRQLCEKMYNNDKKRLDVFFDEQFNSLIDLHSYGHDIEASWLIDRAVDVLGDQKLKAHTDFVTQELYVHVMQKAFGKNGVIYECENGRDLTKRDWWVQAEAMIGIANDMKKHDNPKDHLDKLTQLLAFIRTHVVAPSGEWHMTIYENNRHDTSREIAGPWKGPYHNSRMCMELAERLA